MIIRAVNKAMRPHKYPLILLEMDRQQIGRMDISEAIGVSQTTWTQMTRGSTDPTISQAYAILHYLKLKPDLSKYFPEGDLKNENT